MARLQVITVLDLAENNIRLQCLELSNNMLQELNMEKKAWNTKEKNKTPLLNLFQRSTENMVASMQTWQMI